MAKSRGKSTGRTTSGPDPKDLLDGLGEPMAASSVPLDDPAQYAFEVKFDGYRILACLSRSSGAAGASATVRLESRRGHDWTERFQPIADAVAKLPIEEAVIDGEVLAIDGDGRPSFHRLQQWVAGERRALSIVFVVFDLLRLEGVDLRALPLEKRRELLAKLVEPLRGPTGTLVSFSGVVAPPLDARGRPDVEALMAAAKKAGIEGFVAKRRGSPYVSGRSPLWVKLKCVRRQELAVVGYTPLAGTKANVVGALILALRDENGVFRYAGKVGSGLDDAERRKLSEQLERDRVESPPLIIDERIKDARWSRPKLAVEVSFFEWSDDGKLRHPTFVGIREDKTADDCVREDVAASAPPPSRRPLSNPDKVLYPRDGITKREVLEWYEAIAPVMLPHLRGRPLTLQRWPDGIDGEAWFQQHPPAGTPAEVRRFTKDGRQHLVLDDLEGLRWASNLASLTLHVWSSHIGPSARSDAEIARDLSHPDWLVIDLDPGDGAFAHAIEVAIAVRHLLEALELPSYPKTTGKRGLHILVPVARGSTHPEVQRLGEHLAAAVAKVLPGIATVERSIGKRGGRLYVDYLQNGEGRTIAAPYTLRAIDGAPVSTPLAWSEVGPRLDPMAFTLRTVRARIEARGDLLAPVLQGGPDVRGLLSRLG